MLQYIAQRVVSIIPTLILIAVVGFIIMELPPGDYLTWYIQQLESQGHARGQGAGHGAQNTVRPVGSARVPALWQLGHPSCARGFRVLVLL